MNKMNANSPRLAAMLCDVSVRILHWGLVALAAATLSGTRPDICAAESQISDLEQAATTYNDGRFAEAIKLYSLILKRDPNQSAALCGRGMAYEMANQPTKAEEDFRNAILSDPGNYRAMENLGSMWERSGKHLAEAAELYKRALALDQRPEWQENLKVWIAALESRAKQETQSPVGCWHRANAKAEQGDNQAAETLYAKAIALNPGMYQAYYSRGILRAKLGDLEGARRDFDEAIRIAPQSRGYFVQRALVCERMGDTRQAVQDFERAVVMDPRDPEAFFHLARMREQDGNFAQALQHYQQAMKWRPKPELLRLLQERIAAVSVRVRPDEIREQQRQDSSKDLW
jgi:tetratricopeptide (TPR) repeat protein